jgi:hypothetical protein
VGRFRPAGAGPVGMSSSAAEPGMAHPRPNDRHYPESVTLRPHRGNDSTNRLI